MCPYERIRQAFLSIHHHREKTPDFERKIQRSKTEACSRLNFFLRMAFCSINLSIKSGVFLVGSLLFDLLFEYLLIEYLVDSQSSSLTNQRKVNIVILNAHLIRDALQHPATYVHELKLQIIVQRKGWLVIQVIQLLTFKSRAQKVKQPSYILSLRNFHNLSTKFYFAVFKLGQKVVLNKIIQYAKLIVIQQTVCIILPKS